MLLSVARLILVLGLLCSPLSWVSAAQAPVAPNPLEVERLNLDQAVRVAKSAVPGRVLSAEQIDSLGPLVFRIKLLLDNGRVRTVYVDGETGSIIDLD